MLPHLDSGNPGEAYLAVRACLLSGQSQLAPTALLEHAKRLYGIEQPSPQVTHTYALALFRCGQIEEAESILVQLRTNNSDTRLNHSLTILVRLQAGDVAGARQLLDSDVREGKRWRAHDELANRLLEKEIQVRLSAIEEPSNSK